MALHSLEAEQTLSHPLDLVEHSMGVRDFMAERTGRDELVAEITGRWCDYHLVFAWSDEIGALHMTCAFDVRVQADRRAAVHELLALANDKLWIGHFDVGTTDGLPAFRHALLLRGGSLSVEQIEDLVDIAVSEIDRFYPAFQYVVWGSRRAPEALELAILETIAEA